MLSRNRHSTTNSIEAVNSSLRKVTKKGAFPGEESVRKALYLRITELYKKWNGRPAANWAIVRNQRSMDAAMLEDLLGRIQEVREEFTSALDDLEDMITQL